MDELKILFVIFILFISISVVMGLASMLITPKHADIVFGSLLMISSIAILSIFINSFVFNKKEAE